MRAQLTRALATVTEAEARAIYKALDQFIENRHEYIEMTDDPKREAVEELIHAEAVIERMNAEFARLAKDA